MKTHTLTMVMIVLNLLAVYRAAMLITRDKITERFREWFDHHYAGMIATLLWCPWCVSAYAGAFAAVATWLWWPVWQWVCLGAACSAAAGFLAEHS